MRKLKEIFGLNYTGTETAGELYENAKTFLSSPQATKINTPDSVRGYLNDLGQRFGAVDAPVHYETILLRVQLTPPNVIFKREAESIFKAIGDDVERQRQLAAGVDVLKTNAEILRGIPEAYKRG